MKIQCGTHFAGVILNKKKNNGAHHFYAYLCMKNKHYTFFKEDNNFMNNQFTQRVSDIITYSKEEANRLRNSYIGPEHLLLGVISEGVVNAIEIL